MPIRPGIGVWALVRSDRAGNRSARQLFRTNTVSPSDLDARTHIERSGRTERGRRVPVEHLVSKVRTGRLRGRRERSGVGVRDLNRESVESTGQTTNAVPENVSAALDRRR